MENLTKKKIDQLTFEIIGAAIDVHKTLGPGLLESTYHECMKIALRKRGLSFETEMRVEIEFQGEQIASTLRCDLFVEGLIVVELKSVTEILPVHRSQVMSYMTVLKAPKGILINFNCQNIFRQGQQTFVNKLYAELPA